MFFSPPKSLIEVSAGGRDFKGEEVGFFESELGVMVIRRGDEVGDAIRDPHVVSPDEWVETAVIMSGGSKGFSKLPPLQFDMECWSEGDEGGDVGGGRGGGDVEGGGRGGVAVVVKPSEKVFFIIRKDLAHNDDDGCS